MTSETNLHVGFGDGVITNIFNYRTVLQDALLDVDASTATFFHIFTYLDQHQISDELRYAGSFGPVDLTVGGYYFKQSYMYLERRILGGGAFDRVLGGHIDQESMAAFAQSDVHLSRTLSATLGIRYSTEKKDAIIDRAPAGTGASNCSYITKTCPFSFLPKFIDSKRWSAWTPKVSLNWKPSSDLLAYVTWSKGVRNGGYNVRSSSSTVPPGPYDPEKQDSFETGFKSDLFDRRIRLNGAAFLSRLKGLQRDITVVPLPPEIGTTQVIRNAADADIYGFEGEFVYAPDRDFQLNLSVGYVKADYKTVKFDLTGDNIIDSRDLALEPPRLARWTIGTGFTWSRPLTDAVKGTLNVNYGYRSRAPINDANSIFVGTRNMLVANLAFALPDTGLEFSVYGRNLLNENRESGRVNVSLAVPPYRFRALDEGRSVGVQVKAHF